MLTPETAVGLVSNAIQITALIVCVLVVPSLLGGLVVSVFQAATQINEQMLSFLPRLLITLGMLIFGGHWILRTLSDLFIETFKQAGKLVG
jgi:flagellar biosynthetic protein FliQ